MICAGSERHLNGSHVNQSYLPNIPSQRWILTVIRFPQVATLSSRGLTLAQCSCFNNNGQAKPLQSIHSYRRTRPAQRQSFWNQNQPQNALVPLIPEELIGGSVKRAPKSGNSNFQRIEPACRWRGKRWAAVPLGYNFWTDTAVVFAGEIWIL